MSGSNPVNTRNYSVASSANRIRGGFLAAFVLLLFSTILSFLSTQKVQEQSDIVNRTNTIIHDLDNTLGYLTSTESSFRGYLIDRQEDHLNQFSVNMRRLDSMVDRIDDQVSGNAEQMKNIMGIQVAIKDVIGTFEKSIQLFDQNKRVTDQILNLNNKANEKIMNVESMVIQMQNDERAFLSQRSSDLSQYAVLIKWLSIFSFVVAVLVTIYSITVFNQENRARLAAHTNADGLRAQLENRVEELANLNAELIGLRSMEKYAATGRIARIIAHEVRNPLTNINLAVEQLHSEYKGEADSEMFFGMVQRNSERINKLVSDLLDSTRLTQLNKQQVSVNDFLKACLKDAGDRVALNHIHVITRFREDVGEFQVDKEKMKIAFTNLIVNAIEAMADGGTLIISTSRESERLIINISDNGSGMNKEQMSRLFEPFFTTKKSGNGLGLANTQNIILNHNGGIKAESEEGKGSTFTITFDLEENV